MATQYLEGSRDLLTWSVLDTNTPPTAVTNDWPVSVNPGYRFYRISVPFR